MPIDKLKARKKLLTLSPAWLKKTAFYSPTKQIRAKNHLCKFDLRRSNCTTVNFFFFKLAPVCGIREDEEAVTKKSNTIYIKMFHNSCFTYYISENTSLIPGSDH